eukprot:3645347-Alexandrium_andersonii.AAC.1
MVPTGGHRAIPVGMIVEVAALLVRLAECVGRLVSDVGRGSVDAAALAGLLAVVDRLTTILRQLAALAPATEAEGAHVSAMHAARQLVQPRAQFLSRSTHRPALARAISQ